MSIWRLLQTELEIPLPKLLGMSAVAGFSNALLLVIINYAAQVASGSTEAHVPQQPSILLLLLFIATISVYILSQRFILRLSDREVERLIGRLRKRLADKIRMADLQPLEQLGHSYISTIITR